MEKPNFPILNLHVVVSVPFVDIKTDKQWAREPVLGDDGLTLMTGEQIELRGRTELIAEAKQFAMGQAAIQLADIACRGGHVIEEKLPAIGVDEATFQFSMMIVPAEKGEFPFDSLLRDAFNAGVTESCRLVTRARDHLQRVDNTQLQSAAEMLSRIAKDIEDIKRE